MNRVHVLVEGQTEEAFVGRCVRPHLWNHNVDLSPKFVVTRRVRSGPDYKGGLSSWKQIACDLRLLLRDTGAVAVTTLLDYYGLPTDVPGMSTRPNGSSRDRALHVQSAIDENVGDLRLRSNLLLHEYEALLYSEPDTCGRYLSNPSLSSAMHAAVAACGAPELVNDDPVGAPSKRMVDVHPAYRKTLDGPALADMIGLAVIRQECPHFGVWVAWLESIGGQGSSRW